MTNLNNRNPDGAHDGQQRRLDDFQFDLENVLTISQMVGKSAEEGNAVSVMLDILAGTKNKTAAEVAVEVVTEAPRISGQKVLYGVLAANTARRATVIVREDATKNVAWAWAKLRGRRFGRDSGERRVSQKCVSTVGRTRSRSKTRGASGSRSPKLPQGSLSSQAIEQLTISGLSRHGQPRG